MKTIYSLVPLMKTPRGLWGGGGWGGGERVTTNTRAHFGIR